VVFPGRATYPGRVPESLAGAIVFSLTPTILVGLIFWFIVRALLRSDRTERAAYAKVEAEERAKAEAEERAESRDLADRAAVAARADRADRHGRSAV
jgi:flagellar biosynthesis/type III secretory pathway M-ring protein FliF/YscJ